MSSSRSLPWWPCILFGVLEPLALVAGAHDAIRKPEEYFFNQVPTAHHSIASPVVLTPAAKILVIQLGNIYFLLAGLGVLCCFFAPPSRVKAYLAIVAVADLGHMYGVYAGLGEKVFLDVGNWNVMVAANVGVSTFLCVNRILTVLGAFGRVRRPSGVGKRD